MITWYLTANENRRECTIEDLSLSHKIPCLEMGLDLWTTKAALKCRIFFKASVALETVPLSFVNTCRSFKERESSLIRRSHKVNSYCQLWKKTREITVVENYSKSLILQHCERSELSLRDKRSKKRSKLKENYING